MKYKTNENIFYNGPIPADYVSKIIEQSNDHSEIGAHTIFLGQIRRDRKENKNVALINYSAQEALALVEFKKIMEEIHEDYDILYAHVRHSLGAVKVGEICLFVFISSAHRTECQMATDRLVENIKKRLPIFGKEAFEDGNYQWKMNTEKLSRN